MGCLGKTEGSWRVGMAHRSGFGGWLPTLQSLPVARRRAKGTFWHIFDPVFARRGTELGEIRPPKLRIHPTFTHFGPKTTAKHARGRRRENECGIERATQRTRPVVSPASRPLRGYRVSLIPEP